MTLNELIDKLQQVPEAERDKEINLALKGVGEFDDFQGINCIYSTDKVIVEINAPEDASEILGVSEFEAGLAMFGSVVEDITKQVK